MLLNIWEVSAEKVPYCLGIHRRVTRDRRKLNTKNDFIQWRMAKVWKVFGTYHDQCSMKTLQKTPGFRT